MLISLLTICNNKFHFAHMITRTLAPHLARLFRQYPVITMTGPRQSGKTTLCRNAFAELPYVSLEDPDQRERAREDPRGFLKRYDDGAVFDEIQNAPDLPSYLQGIVDRKGRNGLFVLTGSQQFAISQSVSQSLAGRTAVVRLLPFSLQELLNAPAPDTPHSATTDELLWTGFYPRIHDHGLNPTEALSDYFETYVQRDVRQISMIRDLSTFQKFVRLCAGRVGQLLNVQSLGNDVGVSHTTAREWLSVLEASFIVFLLQPFHANLSKRLTKRPKLYFHDVGLAAFLMGIQNPQQIATHPLRGSLFENLIVGEALKHRLHHRRPDNLFFYRESTGAEVDLIWSVADRLNAAEIKAGATFHRSSLAGLGLLEKRLGDAVARRALVHDGDGEPIEQSGVTVVTPRHFPWLLDSWETEESA